MADKYEVNYQYLSKLYLSDIVFEKRIDSQDVTIIAYFKNPIEEESEIIYLSCDFSILIKVLIFLREEGDFIINEIAEKFRIKDNENITIIEIENLLGKPLEINNIVFTIYRPKDENEQGEFVEITDETIYCIDSVESKDLFEDNKISFDNLNDQLAEYFIMLDISYKYFLQLLSLDMPEKNARKKSGLKDELLFRIATINHLIINKGS
ncbi:MAG TPA: hypothetical protein PK536_11815 [Ignavibacteria bacterium]|nr:hypothetical protein [Bacteroidota bacterium]HRI86121.1 hypothetical protein [Ignavibacteria bacterium]HRK00449.1 hypothetical protein [Ignavibacteria bacterium]